MPEGGNKKYKVVFAPTKDAMRMYSDLTTVEKDVDITVNKAAPTGNVKFKQREKESQGELAEIASSSKQLIDGKATYTWIPAENNKIYNLVSEYEGDTNYTKAQTEILDVNMNKKSQNDLSIVPIEGKKYVDEEFTLSTSGGSGTGKVTYSAPDDNIIKIVDNKAKIVAAGEVIIKANKAADDEYNEAIANYTLIVAKRNLTIKPDDKKIQRGQPIPDFTYTATGLAKGDKASVTLSLGAGVTADKAGTYPIKVTNQDNPFIEDEAHKNKTANYIISYENGNLTVEDTAAQQAPQPKPVPQPQPKPEVKPSTPSYQGGAVVVPSSSNNNTPKTDIPKAPEKAEDKPEKKPSENPVKQETAEIAVTSEVKSDRQAAVTISDKEITEAIAKAETAVKLNINLPKKAKSLKLTLTKESVDKIADSGLTKVDIDTKLISASFDKNAILELQHKSENNVDISIKPVTKLTKQAKKLVGKHLVYDIKLSEGSKNITKLDEGNITFKLPYKLSKKENAEGLYAVSINRKGKATKIKDSYYDKESGCLVFTAKAMSKYGIAYAKPKKAKKK